MEEIEAAAAANSEIDNHWRAGWRMLVYIIAAFIIGKAFSTPLKLLVPGVPESDFVSWTHTLIWLVGTLALLIGGLLVLRFFDRRPPALLGLGFSHGWLRELAVGLAGGLLATGLLVLMLVACAGFVSGAFHPGCHS